jgi:hypothetical protein
MKNPIIFENPAHYDCKSTADGTDQSGDITLRDIFAAFALAGMASNPTAYTKENFGKNAYECADRLLKSR